ncbi:MAG: hypothetical protein IAA81_08500 [Spirochaetes bacterium]|uniref:Uncharacterized protein n=1 Tax=Candidatus Gallitreponema excrementavium TaxID=2840840 RepID=A0A9D9HQS1_9SPIR|nr:hypothetical protein [Candidatus Gallitreponema excrementavium]
MKMFLDEFKVLDMNELIAVNGGYGSSSGGSRGSSSSSGYSSASGGGSSSYSSSRSSTGSSHYAETSSYVSSHYGTIYSKDAESKVPEGYSATYGWLNGEGDTCGTVDGNTASNNDIDSDNSDNARYFLQGAFAGEFGEDFSDSACAATSLLNGISEQYTEITGQQMTAEQAEAAIRAAVENGSINSDNAYVNNWESAANDMWSATGLDGSFSYGGSEPTIVIYACDNVPDQNGEADHFVLGTGKNEYFDPYNGDADKVDKLKLAKTGLGSERPLTFN